jgi:riboflavin kinase/FMN adenylyltransferase
MWCTAASSGRDLGASTQQAGDGFRTLNLRFSHWNPAASGIFAVLVHGLGSAPAAGRRQPGHPPVAGPDDVNGGRVLLETHCLQWPHSPGCGRCVR